MTDSAFKDDGRNGLRSNEPTDLTNAAAGDSDGYQGLTPRMAWRVASVLFFITTIGCLLQTLPGVNPAIEHRWVILALGAISLMLSATWWSMSTRDVSQRWLHVGLLSSYLLLTAVLNEAPRVQAHLGIAYLLPLIFAALFMPSRSLVFYIGLSVSFIGYSMVSHAHEPFGVIPGLMTIAALVSTALLTLYVRLQLDSIGRQAAVLSGRDALTGLANLRPLYERVDVLLRRAERDEGGLSVVMLDLDGFKRVNDQHSHSVGDATLRVVADVLSDSVRRDELVARRGGDEFAIVSEATDSQEIEALIGRIAGDVAKAREELLPGLPSGITAGYATFREGDTVGQLLARADRMLHETKTASRQRRWSWRDRLDELSDELGFEDA